MQFEFTCYIVGGAIYYNITGGIEKRGERPAAL